MIYITNGHVKDFNADNRWGTVKSDLKTLKHKKFATFLVAAEESANFILDMELGVEIVIR
ncbi:hypothetical protein DSO57_1017228 [Entomophthora muscae]|uniref:Uncharacterized protein n=1 Tax=Entomophthora muscae TaxID=34485 RepID=A0ACC2STN8_9FUNG|nr:hypothetical protein DSO57_1017228 [Entomophthora muscae]